MMTMRGVSTGASRRGPVHRAAVPGGARAVRVGLSAEGRRLAGELTAEISTEVEHLLAALSTAERHRLGALLARVLE